MPMSMFLYPVLLSGKTRESPRLAEILRGRIRESFRHSKGIGSIHYTLTTQSELENIYLGPLCQRIGGASLGIRDESTSASSSTMTTIQTPTLPSRPNNGVQCIHRGRPRPRSFFDTHRTLAVMPCPCAKACSSVSWTRLDPPMRSMKQLWSIPGIRRDGDANSTRRLGYGRTSR
jgi:hypothetical protein